ncbi:MAG: hypothetical protein A3J83_00405 [Elusimicrobia bacterium RIFOXYA2_FULL_40_6]|nr:MAG: hypothetical protein A3J83_00405 [Elusimicrobia bacterium RIFOXYA2_FULL_40_6]
MKANILEKVKNWIITISRVRDPLRNTPELVARMLSGEVCVNLGRGMHKYGVGKLNPQDIGCVQFWTKGPVSNMVEVEPLYHVLKDLIGYNCLIALELTVTGLGGTFIEPGIKYWEDTAEELKKVLTLAPTIILPEAVTVRYDPVATLKLNDGRIISNMNLELFEEIVKKFTGLGIKRFTTKPLLEAKDGYPQVNEKFNIVQCCPIPIEQKDFRIFLEEQKKIAKKYNATVIRCCDPDKKEETGCVDGNLLLAAGKTLFGNKWNRISLGKRASRKLCLCNDWWDLGMNEGLTTCFTTQAGCLYCSPSGMRAGTKLAQAVKTEYESFLNNDKSRQYQKLIEEVKKS